MSGAKVVSGSLVFEVDGVERRLTDGESISIPANTPHRFWTDSKQETHSIAFFEPALEIAAFFETLFSLAEEGKIGENGMPDAPAARGNGPGVRGRDSPPQPTVAGPSPAGRRPHSDRPCPRLPGEGHLRLTVSSSALLDVAIRHGKLICRMVGYQFRFVVLNGEEDEMRTNCRQDASPVGARSFFPAVFAALLLFAAVVIPAARAFELRPKRRSPPCRHCYWKTSRSSARLRRWSPLRSPKPWQSSMRSLRRPAAMDAASHLARAERAPRRCGRCPVEIGDALRPAQGTDTSSAAPRPRR